MEAEMMAEGSPVCAPMLADSASRHGDPRVPSPGMTSPTGATHVLSPDAIDASQDSFTAKYSSTSHIVKAALDTDILQDKPLSLVSDTLTLPIVPSVTKVTYSGDYYPSSYGYPSVPTTGEQSVYQSGMTPPPSHISPEYFRDMNDSGVFSDECSDSGNDLFEMQNANNSPVNSVYSVDDRNNSSYSVADAYQQTTYMSSYDHQQYGHQANYSYSADMSYMYQTSTLHTNVDYSDDPNYDSDSSGKHSHVCF